MINKDKEMREDMLPLAIEDKVNTVQRNGYKVKASIRGFRVAASPLVYYYIEMLAFMQKKVLDLGFWPGMTSDLREAEDTLKVIQASNKEIEITPSTSPVLATTFKLRGQKE